MGYRAAWYPESRGREAIATAALLLDATERMVAVSGIASIWARDATASVAAGISLGEAWPGRFVLGLGVSHAPSVKMRGGTYDRPLTRMAEYLDQMESIEYGGPGDAVPVILANLGPKMTALAAQRTAGAHPYFVPVEHTRVVRSQEPDVWLAPEQAVVIDPDPETARATARTFMGRYLLSDNYRRNLLRLGWDEKDLDDGGSDDVVDAIVGWGDLSVVEARIRGHLDAGADHVGIQVLGGKDAFALDDYRALAAAFL